MEEIDGTFIPEPQHRPNPSLAQEAQGIPLIDLSSPDLDALIDEIGHACRQWGFFQIINHGVLSKRRHELDEAARKFFHQSLDEKRKVRRDAGKVMGYYDTEHTQNVRDWKELFDFTVQEPTLAAAFIDENDDGLAYWQNQWPRNPPEMRDACREYAKDMVELAMRLMELIAMNLGLPARRFDEFFKDHTSSGRINRYPPCPSPELVLGVGPHKDPGVLTILAQDEVGGLEVKRKSDGQWVGVKPIPDAYIINLGDVLQVWTNGEYESVEHRVVVNSVKERYSISFFLNPSHYTMVRPLEELEEHQNAENYRAYNWGKFQLTMKRSNFTKLQVENIQIHHSKNVPAQHYLPTFGDPRVPLSVAPGAGGYNIQAAPPSLHYPYNLAAYPPFSYPPANPIPYYYLPPPSPYPQPPQQPQLYPLPPQQPQLYPLPPQQPLLSPEIILSHGIGGVVSNFVDQLFQNLF